MKKDAVYVTKFCIWLACGCILAMTLFATALSWSQNHTFRFDFLLNGALACIFSIFVIRSFTHPNKDDKVIWIIRRRHGCRIVAVLFFGVLVFGVNSELHWVRTLHMVFTASAILAVYLLMILVQKRTVERIAAILGAILGIGWFVVSVYNDMMNIADGEAIAALPIMFWIDSTTKIY